MAEKPRYRVG